MDATTTAEGGVNISRRPVFDRPLFSTDVIILFENLDTTVSKKTFLDKSHGKIFRNPTRVRSYKDN